VILVRARLRRPTIVATLTIAELLGATLWIRAIAGSSVTYLSAQIRAVVQVSYNVVMVTLLDVVTFAAVVNTARSVISTGLDTFVCLLEKGTGEFNVPPRIREGALASFFHINANMGTTNSLNFNIL